LLHRPRRSAGTYSGKILVVSVVVACAAVTVLTGTDGSIWWRSVRAFLVVALTVGLVLGVRRRQDRWRGTIAVIVGLVAVSAGLGIGVGHLLKSDLGIVVVAGLALLVAGFVLLLTGAADLVMSVGGWRRLPVAMALLVLSVLVVQPSWSAFYATNTPRVASTDRTPADVQLDYREVHFRTPDGVRLAAWWVPSRNGAAVVLRHGAGSTRSAVIGHAAVLAGGGYGVLLVDARGHGASEGRGMDFGWYGDEDVAGSLDFLTQQRGVDPARLAVVGMSMGGEEAIGAAATDSRIRAVVAEGAAGRTTADLAWLSDKYGPRGTFTRAWYWLLNGRLTDMLTDARPPVSLHDAVALAAPRRVLLIAAGDVPDEASAVAYIRSASPDTVEVWQVPHTGHTQGLRTHPQQWQRRVLSFLDQAMPASN
jgi:pimeloyl-ACP methyl ester carboxylesterase